MVRNGKEKHHYLKKERTEQARIEGSKHLKLSDSDQSAQLPRPTSIRKRSLQENKDGKRQEIGGGYQRKKIPESWGPMMCDHAEESIHV